MKRMLIAFAVTTALAAGAVSAQTAATGTRSAGLMQMEMSVRNNSNFFTAFPNVDVSTLSDRQVTEIWMVLGDRSITRSERNGHISVILARN